MANMSTVQHGEACTDAVYTWALVQHGSALHHPLLQPELLSSSLTSCGDEAGDRGLRVRETRVDAAVDSGAGTAASSDARA